MACASFLSKRSHTSRRDAGVRRPSTRTTPPTNSHLPSPSGGSSRAKPHPDDATHAQREPPTIRRPETSRRVQLGALVPGSRPFVKPQERASAPHRRARKDDGRDDPTSVLHTRTLVVAPRKTAARA